MNVSLVLQFAAALVGLIAAFFWWKSAVMGFEKIPSLPEKVKDGAMAFKLEDQTYLLWDLPKQAKLNSNAAIATAIATLIQAISLWVQIAEKS